MTKVVLVRLKEEAGKKKKKLDTELLGVIKLSWIPPKGQDLFFVDGLAYKIYKCLIFVSNFKAPAVDEPEPYIELILERA
jgi:hypothetical protein